jgi:manganese/zinc/iron transport system substrate-binding protein
MLDDGENGLHRCSNRRDTPVNGWTYERIPRRVVLGLLAGTLPLLMIGRRAAGQAAAITVVATTGQVADLVRRVGGDRVAVQALMGPGVDPHLYQASEGDVVALSEADVIFFNGLRLEGKIGDLLDRLAESRPTVAVAEAVPQDRLRVTPDFGGHADPHVWFDPTLWRFAVDRVEQALAEVDPDHAQRYADNAAAYRAELEELDRYAQERIAEIPEGQRVLVTAHDAFGYFGARYGLEVIGLQGISTETEAGIADVARLADLIAEREIPAVFVETSVSPRTVEAVQAAVRDRGHEVAIGGQLYSDALGEEGTPEGTYVGMFRANVDTIVEALA